MIFPTAGIRRKWERGHHLVVNNEGIIEIVLIAVICPVDAISISVFIVIHTFSIPNSFPHMGIDKLLVTGKRRRGLSSALVGPMMCFKDLEIKRIFARVGKQPGTTISIFIQEDELAQR